MQHQALLLSTLPVEITYNPFVESLEQVIEVTLMKAIQAHEIARIKYLWAKEITINNDLEKIGRL